jgi:membrane protein DedA with SNARE-associated domain
MIAAVLAAIATFITGVISALGYPGIVLLMAIESACIPLPSEVIMPFSGYLASAGRFTVLGTALAGAFGCVVGSIAAYAIGRYGGRAVALKYGRFVLVAPSDILRADRWFERYGQWTVFVSRLLPVVRTFISLPAGVARMRFVPFVVWTFVGSLPWCYALSFVGFKLRENWAMLEPWFRKFDVAIGALIVICAVVWIKHHIGALREGHGSPS